MKRGILMFLGVVAALFVGLLALIAVQPTTVHVERSVLVDAEPADLWPYVVDLRGFVQWSPWEDRDPEQVTEFSEPSAGEGAWYTWSGNDDVGEGKMTVTGAETDRRVTWDLVFIEPFASEAVITMDLAPTGDGATRVTWGFDTENGFVGKAMGLVMNMDDMLGPDFETGLARLAILGQRAAAERAAAAEQAEALEAAATEQAATEAEKKGD